MKAGEGAELEAGEWVVVEVGGELGWKQDRVRARKQGNVQYQDDLSLPQSSIFRLSLAELAMQDSCGGHTYHTRLVRKMWWQKFLIM